MAQTQLARLDAALVAPISQYRRIIALTQHPHLRLYAKVENPLVWSVVATKLALLRREVAELATEQ